MAKTSTGFLKSLDDRVEGILNACTACGDCVSVCPTPQGAGIDVTDPKRIASGVLDILRNNGEGLDASRQWAAACCGTGAHEGDVHGSCQLNVINESAFALQQRCQLVLQHNFLEINGTMCAAFSRLDLLSNPLLASFGLRQFQSWFH